MYRKSSIWFTYKLVLVSVVTSGIQLNLKNAFSSHDQGLFLFFCHLIRVLIMVFRQLLMALHKKRAVFVPPNVTYIYPHSHKYVHRRRHVQNRTCPPIYHHFILL